MIFASKFFTDRILFFLVTLSVIPSICLHEYFHAQVALWCGDPTAAQRGHLTLNPLKQMGAISIIMFLLLGIAWGGVPVNPQNLTRRGRVLTALAGPAMNFLLFLISFLVYPVLHLHTGAPQLLVLYFFVAGVYNLILFCFNILPIPGLDGWNILVQFVRVRGSSSELFKGVMILLIFGMLMLFPYLMQLAGAIMEIPLRVYGGGR